MRGWLPRPPSQALAVFLLAKARERRLDHIAARPMPTSVGRAGVLQARKVLREVPQTDLDFVNVVRPTSTMRSVAKLLLGQTFPHRAMEGDVRITSGQRENSWSSSIERLARARRIRRLFVERLPISDAPSHELRPVGDGNRRFHSLWQ